MRRTLDIVACTHFFGPSSQQVKSKNNSQVQSKDGVSEQDDGNGNELANGESPAEVSSNVALEKEKPTGILKGKPEAMAAMAAAKEATEKGDMAGMCPPSKLGQFYEFFSFSHVTPPIQCE